jgi:hypothetical protein
MNQMTKANFPTQGKSLAADFEPKTPREKRDYAAFCVEHFDREDWPWDQIKRRRLRKRKPNITTFIKRARKAGERGEVRVELVNSDGTRTIITSSREALIDAMTENDAEKLWHERIGNAAH